MVEGKMGIRVVSERVELKIKKSRVQFFLPKVDMWCGSSSRDEVVDYNIGCRFCVCHTMKSAYVFLWPVRYLSITF
jgi:hypothetical protein